MKSCGTGVGTDPINGADCDFFWLGFGWEGLDDKCDADCSEYGTSYEVAGSEECVHVSLQLVSFVQCTNEDGVTVREDGQWENISHAHIILKF